MTTLPTHAPPASITLRTLPAPGHADHGHGSFPDLLDECTAAARERAFERLCDPAAVRDRASYATWLRRTAAAWARVPLPVAPEARRWPFDAVGPACLDVLGPLEADLRDVTMASGAAVCVPVSLTGPVGRGRADSRTREVLPLLAAAVYVTVEICARTADLVPDALALSRDPRTPVGLRFLRRCSSASAARTVLRGELATWAERTRRLDPPHGHATGPQSLDLTARTATRLATALADAVDTRRRGW